MRRKFEGLSHGLILLFTGKEKQCTRDWCALSMMSTNAARNEIVLAAKRDNQATPPFGCRLPVQF